MYPRGSTDQALAEIEAAMVTIRRSQRRRALARQAPPHPDTAIVDVVDAIEAAEQATVSSVAAALDLAQPQASKLVATAVDAGFVERRADQADGRRALLVLTDAGRDLADRVHRFRQDRFAAAMEGWSDAERTEFARLLSRFVAGL